MRITVHQRAGMHQHSALAAAGAGALIGAFGLAALKQVPHQGALMLPSDTRGALALFQQAFELDPHDAENLLALAVVQFRLGDIPNVEALIAEARTVAEGGREDIVGLIDMFAGVLNVRGGRLPAAIDKFENAKRIFEAADREKVNIEGMLTWAFEFEDQPYFAGFRDLATNGIDKPVLNVFRMLGMMTGSRVAVQNDAALPLDVILEPDETRVGSVNEDFAVESMAGDIFQLGNASWRILQVNAGTVRVEDAQGQPPGKDQGAER